MLSPIVAGLCFSEHATEGLLAGIIVSGVQVAISASNTGGAWDNCKKKVEQGRAALKKKLKAEGTNWDTVEADAKSKKGKFIALAAEKVKMKEDHVAAVIGDTVGDPLKDTSGPAINILIKLSAITSLVFGSYIKSYNLVQWSKSSQSSSS